MRQPSATASPTLTYRKIEAGHYAVMRDGVCVARCYQYRSDGSFPVWHAVLNPRPCPAPIAACWSLGALQHHLPALLAAQADAPEFHQAELVNATRGEIAAVDHQHDWYAEPRGYDVDNPPPAAPRWVERIPAPVNAWQVIESIGEGSTHKQYCYTVVPGTPRVLRWATAPRLDTHRIVAVSRQRVNANLSHVRLTLAPRREAGREITLTAMMVRSA